MRTAKLLRVFDLKNYLSEKIKFIKQKAKSKAKSSIKKILIFMGIFPFCKRIYSKLRRREDYK